MATGFSPLGNTPTSNWLGSLVNTGTLDPYQWYDYLQNQNKLVWDREDSAHQREVEDLTKAGLNPWLSVGSSGSPTSSYNPSMDSLSGVLSIMMNNRDFANVILKGADTTSKVVSRIGNFFSDLSNVIGNLGRLGMSL